MSGKSEQNGADMSRRKQQSDEEVLQLMWGRAPEACQEFWDLLEKRHNPSLRDEERAALNKEIETAGQRLNRLFGQAP